MRAWHFVGTHKPFERVDIEEPTAGPGNVVIDVKAAGLCHSDVGILEDEKWLANMKELPVVPGHETAGVISEVGEGVTDWKVGDRVAVWPMLGQGYSVNGAWEDRSEVSTETLVAIPDDVSFAQAAAATDAGMTSVGALTTAGVEKGMKVGIIGFGGLGQIGARVAHLRGAEVYVAEINESAWDRAREAGAVKVAKSITEFADVELDVIIDYAGFGVTTSDALDTVKSSGGGRVVQVGMGKLETTIDTYGLILGRKQLHGSAGGSKEDIEETMRYMASGDLTPVLSEIDFEQIPDGIQQLIDGTAVGRLVAKVTD
ncbi:propanol-preferring alcohol dehydrogenase [Microbacterium ginsengiterrae]|uniref:alcohol dehydrogenase n=1 Tax=Microbacterium ginsengiterrae TaxID=546115 RepID=A0A7W9FCW7_9MICO|nr:zinc-binding dehydrogenase [Microbacterium ginsengiterrae]MBB5742873.1 propanol-preferring alcohol dehydrogenase [Microbacterium ginsengiterrae]